ncbi:MAG: hypothetical protein RLZZ156_2654, partial [Deinococcota bacterium]
GNSGTTSSANRPQAGGLAPTRQTAPAAGSRARPDIDDGLQDFPPEEDLPF